MWVSAEFLFGALTGAAAAGGIGCILRRWCKKEIRGYLDLIDLTADQRRKVEQIRINFLPRVAGIRQELQSRRMQLADLLFLKPLDRDKIKSVVGDISALQLKLEQDVIDHIIEENELLTPEQQKQFHRVIVNQFRGGGLGVHDVRGRH